MLLAIILVIVLLSGGFGYYGHRADWGPGSWSPLGLILIVLLILAVSGRL